MRLERAPGVRQLPALFTRRRGDLVLFDSWRGTYSDNPRAISEVLRERRPDLRQAWVADEKTAKLLPSGVEALCPGSRAYLAALGRAAYVVGNSGMPGYYRKPSGTRYLQTWHGTPLKRVAFDIPAPRFADDRRFLARLRRDVAQWDALVSPNAFSTTIFRRAFRYDGPILETGYPRNDVLTSPTAHARRRSVRRDLGLDNSTTAVLYAPTWRDEKRSLALRLDVAALGRRLGDTHRLLLRPHPLTPLILDAEQRAWVTDVSSYPDIRELYLAADVLLTDYSSAMFDFAVTRKPMLFFAYDLAEYRDRLRGFYFDFEADAPGPLLTTTDQVGAALEELDAIAERHGSSYERFVDRFCALDDGAAGERVVNAFFEV